MTQQPLRPVHEALKAEQPDIRLCHLLDRQFDGVPPFTFMGQEVEDEFIIRLKGSRNTPAGLLEDEEDDQEVASKLKDAPLPHRHRRILDKLSVKKKVYQQAPCLLEWRPLPLGKATDNLIRLTLLSREGKPLYKQPLLLLTNLPVAEANQAQAI